MKALTVEDRFDFRGARLTFSKSCRLQKKMRYEFGRAIGLIANDEKWTVQHQDQTAAILVIAARLKRYGRAVRIKRKPRNSGS
jgi:hypothetical protein